METNKFRSVLPHEPLPKQEYGFIHLQGAFEPKNKRRTRTQQSNILEDVVENGCNDSEESFYWTSQTDLQEALTKCLSDNFRSLDLPDPAHSIAILDPNPPFTKVRITYPSPRSALEVLVAFRSQKLSPAHFFSSIIPGVTFGYHAFQATLITTSPLPPICWSRSNPPKFRRLLAREGEEDPFLLEQERDETRFVFMTGLLENPKPSLDSFWNQTHRVVDAIRTVVNDFDTSGEGVEVFVSHKKMAHSCHIGMRSAPDAKQLVHHLQGRQIEWKCYNTSGEPTDHILSGALFLDYVAVTKHSLAVSKARAEGKKEFDIRGEPSRPECTSTTNTVTIPGLMLVPEFVTPEEEDVLVAALIGPQAPWASNQTTISQTGFVKRLVQHYGYVFDYETADVLRDRSKPGADCPPIPATTTCGASLSSISQQSLQELAHHYTEDARGWELFGCVVERTRRFEFSTENAQANGAGGDRGTLPSSSVSFPDVNQVTVNHYKPGEGIGSHVDTPSAFSDGLLSLSLNSGVVMEFRKVGNPKQKKFVYLPPRSLLLMSGPARYEWEHMIVTRRTDTHNGNVMQRGVRISVTMRTAVTLDAHPSPLPRVESSRLPPTWGVDSATAAEGTDREDDQIRHVLATPSTERDHVHAVYDAIATQWHHTRGKRGVLWPGATQFLQQLPVGSVVADVGCGDGKYFPAIWEAGSYVIGTDISLPLLQKCMSYSNSDSEVDSNSKTSTIPDTCKISPDRVHLRERPAVAVADCMSIPLRSKSCDAAICIAVMHHLSTEQRRLRCIEELARIVKIGGTINIQAWAMEQANDSRRRFHSRDVFVPFNAQPKYLDKVPSGDSRSTVNDTIAPRGTNQSHPSSMSKSVAQVYSEAYKNADFDEKKGLVVFQRYCHVYQKGELEDLVSRVSNVSLLESGYESGNHFVILKVTN